MPKLSSLEELKRVKDQAHGAIQMRGNTGTKISVGMGTCGIAAGARDVMHAILKELEGHDIEASVVTEGCVGLCAQEPLVAIQQAGSPRITYGKVSIDMVPTIIEQHLVNGSVVSKWVVTRGVAI